MHEPKAPYSTLGRRLKYVREQANQTLAEVSGAVEIDEDLLARIEAGQERPAEEILLLLISYFDVQEREALQLWELADYGQDAPEQLKANTEALLNSKSTIMLLALDMRTVYSDGLEINANQAGLTLSFTQAGLNNQASPVARVGMSYEQSEKVLMALQTALLQARYQSSKRLLPPPSPDTPADNKR